MSHYLTIILKAAILQSPTFRKLPMKNCWSSLATAGLQSALLPVSLCWRCTGRYTRLIERISFRNAAVFWSLMGSRKNAAPLLTPMLSLNLLQRLAVGQPAFVMLIHLISFGFLGKPLTNKSPSMICAMTSYFLPFSN